MPACRNDCRQACATRGNTPAKSLFGGFNAWMLLWLAGAAAVWFGLAVWVFHRGLRRYASASS